MRRNTRLQNESCRIATAANLISAVRVLLVPVAIASVFADRQMYYLLCVFALQIALLLRRQWPLHVLVMSALAYVIFLSCAHRDHKVTRLPFGRYAGAAVMGLLSVKAVLDLAAPELWGRANRLIALPVSLYAAGAAVETLIHRAVKQPARSCEDSLTKESPDYTWVAASGLSQVHKL